MAQNPPTGVVCSAGVVEACCCLVSLIQFPVTAIGTLKLALKSRTVDLFVSRNPMHRDAPPRSARRTPLRCTPPRSARRTPTRSARPLGCGTRPPASALPLLLHRRLPPRLLRLRRAPPCHGRRPAGRCWCRWSGSARTSATAATRPRRAASRCSPQDTATSTLPRATTTRRPSARPSRAAAWTAPTSSSRRSSGRATPPAWGDEEPGFEGALAACAASLKRLGLDYVDLYLIHAPFSAAHRVEQWRACLELQRRELCRSVGVSNSKRHLREIEAAGLAPPAVNQLELHPYNIQHQAAAARVHGAARHPAGGLFLAGATLDVAGGPRRGQRQVGRAGERHVGAVCGDGGVILRRGGAAAPAVGGAVRLAGAAEEQPARARPLEHGSVQLRDQRRGHGGAERHGPGPSDGLGSWRSVRYALTSRPEAKRRRELREEERRLAARGGAPPREATSFPGAPPPAPKGAEELDLLHEVVRSPWKRGETALFRRPDVRAERHARSRYLSRHKVRPPPEGLVPGTLVGWRWP